MADIKGMALATVALSLALAGCSAGAGEGEPTEGEAQNPVAAEQGVQGAENGAPSERAWSEGFEDADTVSLPYAQDADWNTLTCCWSAPGLKSDGVARPGEDLYSIHYGSVNSDLSTSSADFSTLAVEGSYAAFADDVCKGIDLDGSSEAVGLSVSSEETVEVNGWEMSKAEGVVTWENHVSGESGGAAFAGYAVVLDDSAAGEGEKTLVWFAVVDNLEHPNDMADLEDAARKTAESFRLGGE